MTIESTVETKWPVRHVLGYLPGLSGKEWCTICLGEYLVVVMAQYDSSPPIVEDGVVYDAANDNASGVAVMLEAIRVIQETDYQPMRSFLFVAYSGEGLDGGSNVYDPEAIRFLQAKTGFTEFKLEAIVKLRGLGGGSGNNLEVSAGGSLRLAETFENAAKRMGVRVSRADEAIDIGVIYEDRDAFSLSGEEAPTVRLHWQGWDEHSRLATDTISTLSVDDIEDAGEALAMALMIIGREDEY
jgi:hypothetical protein